MDRVGGGAGPGGVKAVAPTGLESIVVTIPEGEDQVSLLGEKLLVEGMAGPPSTFTQAGRPIAVSVTSCSNIGRRRRNLPRRPTEENGQISE